MQMKPMNVNAPSVDYTPSSTSTAYQMPQNTGQIIVSNESGAAVYIKAGDSTVSITAPSVGTAYNQSKILNGTTQSFTLNNTATHIAIYSATGTTAGSVNIQYGDGI